MAGQESLTITRRFRAPVEKVYRAWTQGEVMKRWFGSHDSEVILADLDCRVGGRYRIEAKQPGGKVFGVSGIYEIIEPNRKLQFSWAWDATPERIGTVTLTFAATDEGTEMTLHHDKLYDETARQMHNQGWTASFEKLGRYLD